VDRPTVIGFFAPKILIPTWLVEKLTAAELDQIVLHESGHLSRADDWMNLLQKVALVMFPLNPALAWVERQLCFERELACDEHVLRTTGAPKAYAECLASLAEHRLGRRQRLALALGALGRESELSRRVGRILLRGDGMRPAHARLVLGGAMFALLSAAVGLERCPQLVGFGAAQPVSAETVAIAGVRGFGAEAVLFRPERWQQPTHRGEAAMNGAHGSKGLSREMESRFARAAMSGRKAETIPAAKANFGLTREVAARAAPRRPGLQWIEVTSWEGEDGSRLVMTAVQINTEVPDSNTGRRSETWSTQNVGDAAVPVRDGWLIFQL
jgi:BlaR1 peptidase M56